MENKKRYVTFKPSRSVVLRLHLQGTYFTDKKSEKYRPFLDLDDEKAAWLEYAKARDADVRDEALVSKLESAMFDRYYVFAVYVSIFAVHHSHYDLEDVVQEACDGVLTCMRRFDPSRASDANFVTVAIIWVNQRIHHGKPYQMTNSAFVTPIHFLQKIFRGERIDDTDSVDDAAFLKETGFSKSEFIMYRNRCLTRTSADSPVSEDNDSTVISGIDSSTAGYDPDEGCNSVIASDLNKALNLAMSERLSPKFRKVICMRFGLNEYIEPMTLDEVGRELGVTRERVRQIQLKALRSLLSSKRIQRLADMVAS